MRLTLSTLPLGTNNLYAHTGRRRFLTPRARANKEAIAWEACAQYRGEPLEGPVRAEVALFWPDRRNRDVDNVKVLLDALTGILWRDDGQIVDLRVTKSVDRERPRVEVSVECC